MEGGDSWSWVIFAGGVGPKSIHHLGGSEGCKRSAKFGDKPRFQGALLRSKRWQADVRNKQLQRECLTKELTIPMGLHRHRHAPMASMFMLLLDHEASTATPWMGNWSGSETTLER